MYWGGGVPPLGLLKPPLGFIDTYQGDKTMSRLKLCMLQPKFCVSQQSLRMLQQNLASEEAKICYSISSHFLKRFGEVSMVKIHFLQKVLKKWSSFRKKIKKNFHNRGGGSAPFMEFSIIFFEPFPNSKHLFVLHFQHTVKDGFI